MNGAYFSFNGQGRLKASFLHHLPERRQQYGDAFRRTLLGASGVEEGVQTLDLKQCPKILRKFMGAGDHEHIVLFIDELGFLDENLQEGIKPPVVPLLQDLMQYQRRLVPHQQCCVSEGAGSFNIALGARGCSGVHLLNVHVPRQTKLSQPNRFIL